MQRRQPVRGPRLRCSPVGRLWVAAKMSHFFCLAAREGGGDKNPFSPTRTMNKQARSRKFSAKQSARLGAYLAAGLGAAATSTADAAIVNINIGPSGFNIGGVNAGLGLYNSTYGYFPDSGQGILWLGNQEYFNTAVEGGGTVTGLALYYGGFFATDSAAPASPTRFALNAPINGSSNFTNNAYTGASFFKVVQDSGSYSSPDLSYSSPNFGPGSYMGFKTAAGSFGWLEVTWDGTDFEILSGAYETDPGDTIYAGQGAAPIPEPGTWVAMAVFAGGAAFARWRKRRDEAQQEAA